MNYRPIGLILIGIFHLIEPITKTLLTSLYFNISPLFILKTEINQGTILSIFEYFFLFPIAGIAILAVKKWSLPLFIFIEIWVFIANMPVLAGIVEQKDWALLSLLIWFSLINIIYVLYVLIPSVRVAYLDPRIRWWEAKPRYQKTYEAVIGDHPTQILNISSNGVFINYQDDLIINQIYPLSFHSEELKQKLDLKARVVHQFKQLDKQGHGLQFEAMSIADLIKIKKLISMLDKNSQIPRRPPKRNYREDLKVWWQDFTRVILPKKI